MLNYTDQDVINFIQENIEQTDCIEPIGHHNIGRNLVYAIDDNKILKIYFKPEKAVNEINAIPLLRKHGINCPEILHTGKFINEEDYIVFSRLEGVILETIEKDLSDSELEWIYYEMGQTLARLHDLPVIQKYETWVDSDTEEHISLKGLMNNRINKFYNKILPEEHEQFELIQSGYNFLMNNLHEFEGQHDIVLSHHDFSRRNVMVNKGDVYSYAGLIDFEHTKPSDLDLELVDTYVPLRDQDPYLAEKFMEGYESIGTINWDRFKRKELLYKIFIGIVTCSWAKEHAYGYYLTGLDKIREAMKAVSD